MTRSTQELLATINRIKDAVVGGRAKEIPATVAQDVMGSLLQLSAALPAANEQMLIEFRTERERLLERTDELIGVYGGLSGVLQKHIPILDELRRRRVPSGALKAAFGRACENFGQDFDAWDRSFKVVAADATGNEVAGVDDTSTARTELNTALAAVRSLAAKLRGCRSALPDGSQ